jgi:hypothetical protein
MDFSVAPELGVAFPPPALQPNSSLTIMRANTTVTNNTDAGLVYHIVVFRYLDSVTPQQKVDVIVNYTSLFLKCVNPITYQPYIVSFDGGAPNSKEGFDQHMGTYDGSRCHTTLPTCAMLIYLCFA